MKSCMLCGKNSRYTVIADYPIGDDKYPLCVDCLLGDSYAREYPTRMSRTKIAHAVRSIVSPSQAIVNEARAQF